MMKETPDIGRKRFEEETPACSHCVYKDYPMSIPEFAEADLSQLNEDEGMGGIT